MNARAKGFRKFGNVPQEVDGIKFDSMKEAARWGALKLLENAGLIRDLKRQVRFPLEGRDGPIRFKPSNRPAVYVADFTYFDVPKGVQIIEDAKGYRTPEYKLKRAILAAQGVEIIET
ncbi:hypothetical protein Shpa_42 [Paracoccus phage Shpa]|uniref:DUF1064 domain-containing protein n=1 Tax=Paracoccus phage Shpa TaxID=1647282 RepID=A0A0U2C0S3_9CAUD|nr:Holliday junction resolvase [Paracoccus phage Shpa]AKG94553.1 hypothetical protein Shpa_42 [Paracoccus phage Shpa]